MNQNHHENAQKSTSILAKSAQGATFLILLQVGSRALTFLVNQILLRYSSPETIGISTQLEILATSVLFFARESLRVALQRQQLQDDHPESETKKATNEGDRGLSRLEIISGAGRRAQKVVNLAYIAIGLGIPLTYVFAKLYLRGAGLAVLGTACLHRSVNIYALATILELLSEPSFAVTQQQMLYGTRAMAETFATSTRCFITCGTAIWASQTSSNIGSMPFAVGQLSYAVVLNLVYHLKINPIRVQSGFSLFIRPLPATSNLFLSRFSLPILIISLNLYAQSVFKHILTTGDTLLIAALTSLPSQGAYAVASNYGSLVARILFQPLEESSRSLFGRLLPQQESFSPKEQPYSESESSSLQQATSYLRSLLHIYSLISLLSISLGPTIAPILFGLIAGPRWTTTAAPAVLSAYCYYIPLLALNGILEAFVSAVATPAQLRLQSAWMLAFSAAFATTGYLVLKVWDLGARGLVLANAVNMALRIWWSWGFVAGYLRGRRVRWRIVDIQPSSGSIVGGLGSAYALYFLQHHYPQGEIADLVTWAAVAAGYAFIM